MVIYAGIDEAGYGPLFGPMVISSAVFSIRDHDHPDRAPCLWKTLKSCVCRAQKDSRNRIAVNDSKLLYSPTKGVAHLERGVLSFFDHLGMYPTQLHELAKVLAVDEESFRIADHLPWYQDPSGGPSIPFQLPETNLARSRARIVRQSEKSGVRLESLKTAVVFEDRFNRFVRRTGTKAGCSWLFVGAHLQHIWDRWAAHHPLVVIDRQGGRKHYEEPLALLFPRAAVATEKVTYSASEYVIRNAGRSMRVRIQVDSESSHFPVAFASMTAKYLRELFLLRFHSFFRNLAPDVRPTYGYFGDGKRFLREIRPVLEELAVDEDLLVRCC